ncbi:ras-related GTP-binding protein D isoform X1 [Saimiri boliviensis]|uniref:ras-related GTP-binding protein D isoform X1 n=1 Tax=Saimiri boliviensis TaxID=27679 RepID=UPI000533E64F|nr:ras-related GTP-binding protein D isoform X1 [Saimiri boliviensis boliviensis]
MSWLKKGTGGSVTGRVVGSCGCQSRPASPPEGSWGRPGGGWGDPPWGDARQAVLGVAEWPQVSRDPRKHRYLDTLSALRVTTWTSQCLPGILDFSDPFSTEVKPRILLMGLRRSGKSSIQKVVFHKMSPNETLFLESTNKICREDVSNSSFVNFQIWDFPGQIDFFDPTFDYEMIFRGTGALIFVIDSQDDYMEALARLHLTVTRAYKVNTDINFEVFIHKVDGLSDDHKIETQRDIHQRANDDLADAGLEKIHLSFYLTSIYDHSIFEAFSKVVQKLIPQLPTLENLLNIFISNSGIEKAFLFDVVSKIYIATDSTPVDMQTYELCCDMIDVVIDISCIYGLKEDGAGTPYDKESTAIIKLNNTTVLYLKEVTKFLALVCFVREESFERKGLIDYNFHCFRKAIHEVFEVRMKVVKSRKVQNRLQKKKGATPNGTPRVLL